MSKLPVDEDSATKKGSDAEGPIVHEGLLGQGRHPLQLAPDDEHAEQINGGLVVRHHHTSFWSLEKIRFTPNLG